MTTTIRLEEGTLEALKELKNKEGVKSYDLVIKKLIQKEKYIISMFGFDKNLERWKEEEDRAKFRENHN